MKKYVSLIVAILAPLIICRAQGNPQSQSPTEDGIKVEYDRFKDTTSVTMLPERVRFVSNDRNIRFITFSAVFTYPGRELRQAPDHVSVLLGVFAYDWIFVRDRNPRLIALVDEKKAFDVIMNRVASEASADSVLEALAVELTVEQL